MRQLDEQVSDELVAAAKYLTRLFGGGIGIFGAFVTANALLAASGTPLRIGSRGSRQIGDLEIPLWVGALCLWIGFSLVLLLHEPTRRGKD